MAKFTKLKEKIFSSPFFSFSKLVVEVSTLSKWTNHACILQCRIITILFMIGLWISKLLTCVSWFQSWILAHSMGFANVQDALEFLKKISFFIRNNDVAITTHVKCWLIKDQILSNRFEGVLVDSCAYHRKCITKKLLQIGLFNCKNFSSNNFTVDKNKNIVLHEI